MEDFSYNDVYKFWMNNKNSWFRINEVFDIECRIRFEEIFNYHDKVKVNTKYEILGQIILYDQLSRNIFRGQKKSYEFDKLALNLYLKYSYLKNDFTDWDRIFFMMPLKHSENYAIQKLNLNYWEDIISKNDNKLYLKNYNSSLEHYNLIKKFGRFPKRNKILGRENTPYEKKYLENNKRIYL